MDLRPEVEEHVPSTFCRDVLDPFRRALQENEDWYQDLVENSQDLLCIHDLQGRFLSMNPAPARVLGYSVEEMLRTPMRNFIVPEFRPEFDSYLAHIACHGEAQGLLCLMTRSGDQRVWSYHNTLRTNEVASPIVRGIAHDVTEQLRSEKLLRKTSHDLLLRVQEGERTIKDLRLFRALLDQSNDAIEVVDSDTFRFLDANERACSDLGYTREEFLSLAAFDINPSLTQAAVPGICEELRISGSIVMEGLHRRKDGTTFPVEISMKSVRLDRDYIVVVVHDLTKRRIVESQLRSSERQYRAVHELSPIGISWTDERGRFLKINPKYCEIVGRTQEELLALDVQSITHPDDLAGGMDTLWLLTSKEVQHCKIEKRYLRPDGSVRWAEADVASMRSAGQGRQWFISMVQDITERKQADERLREFERVVESLDEMIVVVDRKYQYTLANASFLRQWQVTREQVVGQPVKDVISKHLFEDVAKGKLDECFAGRVVNFEIQLNYPGIGTRQIAVQYSPVEGPAGIEGAACVMRDITERKQKELRLLESESRYRAVHELSPVGICWIDVSGRFLKANPQYCEIVNRSEQDLLGRTFQSLTHPDDLKKNLEELQRLLVGEVRQAQMEKRYMRPDGSFRWVDVSVALMVAEKDTPSWFLAIVNDITERKQASEALRESELRERAKSKELETVLGLVPVAVCIAHDSECSLMTGNQAAHKQFGVPLGNNISQSAPAGERPLFRVMENDEEVPSHMLPIQQAAARGVSISGRPLTIVLEDGRRRETIASAVPLFNEHGTPWGAVAASIDITELMHAETALKAAKEFSENLIQTANVIVLSLDMKGNVVLLNQAAEEITGYTFEDLKGKNWAALVPRDRFPGVWEEFDRIVAGAAGKTFENPILTKSGEERYIAWRNNPVKVDGQIIGTISFGIDITESKRVQENLRSSEEKYRLFVSQSSEGIFRQDMDAPVPVNLPEDDLVHHILYDHYMAECNDAMAAMYGLSSAKEMIGKRLTELLVADDPSNIELTRDFIRSGFRIIDRKSHEVDIHGNPKVFLNSMIGMVEKGLLVGTWGIQRDITEKSKAEEARVRAEEALRQNVVELQKVTEDLRVAKEKLSEEKLYLEESIGTELGFGDIIGRSAPLKSTMEKVAKVAPNDATVLLLGETGTGKELVARALHQKSQRKDASFIKMNCAAIPSGLLESELFGHEKGAFTGAVAKKLGRLELADHGTLFLDEVGEIPLALQPKLLRVLQDQEFERLGGTKTIKVNFRLLAATNRDLLQSVKAKEFRSDLYYRLNVFPIVIPPLRDRREDIPLLVEHFVRKYSSRMNKAITSIPAKAMEALVQWSWPGNIRELENFVERTVILTPGMVLQPPLGELRAEPVEDMSMTLRDKDRDSILRMLKQCRGQLGGPYGAAARLGLKRTTLQSRLNQLGINPDGYRD